MTKLPLEDRAVVGLDAPGYEPNLVCPVPGCGVEATEPHHLWRRSFLAGEFPWVVMPDGTHVGNVMYLCNAHHHMITINAAWIRLDPPGVFTWTDMLTVAQPLLWQPPTRRDDELRDSDGRDAGDHLGVDDLDLRPGDVAHTHDGSCPTCLRPFPHKREHAQERRPRRTWSVTVPKDEREDGAETLDTLLEEARKEMARAGLPYGDEDTVKFFVLAAALGLFVTHADQVLSDV